MTERENSQGSEGGSGRWEKLTPEQMDKNAIEAQNDIVNFEPKAFEEVAKWWKKWYLKAGHKRLGRILKGGI